MALVTEKKRPVRKRIALDGNEVLEAWLVVLAEAGREAFSQPTGAGE